MTQLSCEVPEPLARRVEEKACEVHLSVSEYLVKLLDREVGDGWPEGYFDQFGGWQGEAFERPEQDDCEQRGPLD